MNIRSFVAGDEETLPTSWKICAKIQWLRHYERWNYQWNIKLCLFVTYLCVAVFVLTEMEVGVAEFSVPAASCVRWLRDRVWWMFSTPWRLWGTANPTWWILRWVTETQRQWEGQMFGLVCWLHSNIFIKIQMWRFILRDTYLLINLLVIFY